MAERQGIRITANFERNLESIRCYFQERTREERFEALLDQIFQVIIPNLERYPLMGTDFLTKSPVSVEALKLYEQVMALLPEGASLRQLFAGDYVVLYLLLDGEILLLSIKHQRQLSFDLKRFYAE